MAWLLKLLSLAILLTNCCAYKILVVVTFPGKSHGILGEGIVRHLINAGHEVTFVTSFPPKPKKNLKVVDVSENFEIVKGGLLNIQNMMEGNINLQSILTISEVCLEIGKGTIENPRFQNLLKDTSQTFDVIILEWLYNDLYAGLSAVYNCPYIWYSSLEPHWMVLRLIDELTNPAYVSDSASSHAPPYTFQERTEELFNQMYGMFVQSYYIEPLENKYYDTYLVPHVRSRNRPVPSLTDLKYNASLMLSNSHASLGEATRLPQNFKPIGGHHIETDVKPLPENLKQLMDNAEHGVIYFSMGSNLRSEDLPEELTSKILKIFGELKQTVLWKFERDLPNRPKNVHIVNWAPQQSILAHPRCLFFISHGGLLSTTEAVHFGVPMITIPVMVDQFVNADRAVRKGFAIKVDLSYTMDVDIKRAIHEMLTDPKYKAKAKEISLMYHDRPSTPGNELVHWVEHVVRTQGAPHLRSPALMVPWYQKCYLDLLSVILLALTVIIFIIKTMYRMVFRKSDSDKNKKNK
ncbi:UDP-glucosyltransferase 2-like [Colias croceus]|uniref:UDP-glucosyltransferase 2-like n=1 Tax=Colias crocea TaxID=72248 RepID=UPI001E280672|nr:UDP-glucosyltransferase 2-like [Colias croceus]